MFRLFTNDMRRLDVPDSDVLYMLYCLKHGEVYQGIQANNIANYLPIGVDKKGKLGEKEKVELAYNILKRLDKLDMVWDDISYKTVLERYSATETEW